MDDVFKDPKDMSPENFSRWLEYKEKGRSQILGLTMFLSLVALVGGTIVLLAWSPWN